MIVALSTFYVVIFIDDEFMLKSNSLLGAHWRNTDDIVNLFLSVFVHLSHLCTSNTRCSQWRQMHFKSVPHGVGAPSYAPNLLHTLAPLFT